MEAAPDAPRLAEGYRGDNIVFIVGCPRSGTTWLQALVASNPSVRTGKESHLFQWYLGPLVRHWNRERKDQDVGLGNYFTEDEFRAVMRGLSLQLLSPMAAGLKDGELFLEKTPYHCLFMDEISEVLPQARFLHMLRDCRDVASSMVAASKTWAKSWAPDSGSTAAETWVKSVKAVRESAKALPPDRFLEVRYEALWADPQKTLTDVARFLRLEWDDGGIKDAIARNDARAPDEGRTRFRSGGEYASRVETKGMKNEFIRSPAPGGWKKGLSWADRVRVWRAARETMAEFGYPWPYPW